MAAHREHWCAWRVRGIRLALGSGMVRRRSAWHPRSWDPLVVAPPAMALVVVVAMLVAMLLGVTITAERSAPEPRSMGRDASESGASSAFAAARSGAPVRPAPRERML